ncbi:uncharacterized protein LOC129599078 [Paramacrobiotus metropolitanus]|uniref:uncharacterized protein LOC129599078 n=1 Tax=Paramacrobiotus metropolitanus TaxID=2943436 RepID=UPI0024462F82|nr:uncharacterized protein LOC129599078 [Paramacrobiotus metropolitanus]
MFDSLLTSAIHFPDVHVTGRSVDPDRALLSGLYWTVACLLKWLSQDTSTLIITGLGVRDSRRMMSLIRYSLPAPRIGWLVFDDCRFFMDYVDEGQHEADGAIEDDDSLAGDLALCDRMVWKNCHISDDYLQAFVARHVFEAPSRQELDRELWDVFEKSLVLPEPVNLPALSLWVAGRVADHQKQQIAMVLDLYQSADPRLSTAYRGRQWMLSDICDLDVSRLTTLTVAVLNVIRPVYIT